MSDLLKILVIYLCTLLLTNQVSNAQQSEPNQDTNQPAPTYPPSYPQPEYDQPEYAYQDPTHAVRYPSAVNHFHRRLNSVYSKSNENTLGQQIVYGSIELLAYYRLGKLLDHTDRQTIEIIRLQLKALEDNRPIEGYVREYGERERITKINALKKKLSDIEGNMAQKLGRGAAKFAIRGGQLYLVLSVGSRIYVLAALNEKDPGFFPLPKMTCTAFDCDRIVEEIMAFNPNRWN